MIQEILAYGITYQVKPPEILLSLILRVKGFLRPADGPGLQPADNLIINQLGSRQLQLKFGPFGF